MSDSSLNHHTTTHEHQSRLQRGTVLAVASIAQFMVVLDSNFSCLTPIGMSHDVACQRLMTVPLPAKMPCEVTSEEVKPGA
jgi:hypothetical protein